MDVQPVADLAVEREGKFRRRSDCRRATLVRISIHGSGP